MSECKLFRIDGSVGVYSFAQGPASIGRGAAANLRIDDEFISRVHCEVFLRENQVVLRDMNSINGTIVNGQRIQEKILVTGDHLKLGETQLTFQLDNQMILPETIGDPPKHESTAVFRIIPTGAVKPIPSETVRIQLPEMPQPKV